jgi:hypothetical protein
MTTVDNKAVRSTSLHDARIPPSQLVPTKSSINASNESIIGVINSDSSNS